MSLTNSNGIETDFDLVLDPGQTTLRAYVTRAPDGMWVAWAPYFFRILRRQARALRSHLDLADDVVSTLYDPRDVRNTAAVYSLANVTDLGLLQLYGGRAVHPDRDTASALAEASSARLVTALKGRYRKSVISPLTVPEATAYYYHLLNCRHVAALLGQPVRRMTSGAVSTDGIGQLVAADAQEQLETIVAGLEDVPFAIQCTLAPYAALEITALLRATAEELSRFASQVKGSDSLNISISPGSLLTPLSAVMQQNVRSTGISHVERRTVLESQAEELAASRQQAHATWDRTAASQESYAGHTDTNYSGGSHVEEHTVSHAEEKVDLQRDYAEQYVQHKSFTGVDQGALRTQDSRQVQQTGDRQTTPPRPASHRPTIALMKAPKATAPGMAFATRISNTVLPRAPALGAASPGAAVKGQRPPALSARAGIRAATRTITLAGWKLPDAKPPRSTALAGRATCGIRISTTKPRRANPRAPGWWRWDRGCRKAPWCRRLTAMRARSVLPNVAATATPSRTWER